MRKRDHGAQDNHARTEPTDRRVLRRSLRARLLITVAMPIAALVVAIAAIFVVRTVGARAAAESRHALESQLALARLTSLVLDAETGTRGYLATGRNDSLQPYDDALGQLPAARDDVWRLLASDPGQADALRQLDPALTAELTALTTLRTTGPGATPAQRTALLSSGKTSMDALRSVLAQLGERARTVQDQKAAAAGRLRGAVTAITLAAGGLGLIGGLAAILVVSAGLTRRVNLVQDNARRLAEGRPLLPATGGEDELGALGATMSRTAELMADRQALLELTLTTGGLLLFEIQAGGRISFRGDPRLLAELGLTAGRPVRIDDVRELLGLSDDLMIGRMRSGTSWTDIAVATTTGEERRLAVRWRRLQDEAGAGQGVLVVGVATDVTDRVRAQHAFELARDAAETANRAKDEFLSRMSHELRTPLNAVLGFAQLLSMDDLDEEQRDNVDHILRGGRHLLALVNEVLDLARVESGTFALSIEAIRIRDVADDAVRMMRPIAAEHAIAVSLLPDSPHDAHVDADQQRLKQLLVNLVSNGIKYNRRGGSVQVGWRRADGEDDQIEIEVADTGLGIPAHKLPELFTPFDRLGAEQTAVEGTGLGLALSHRLAQAMGGDLRLVSTGPDGSRFVVTLPGAEAPCAPPVVDDTGTRTATAPPDLHDVRMLYVEDNLANLSLIEELIRRAQAPAPLTAVQGRLGIELAQVHQPDLILLDRHLPDMRGDDVLQTLRADPRTAGIPVIVISADVLPGRGSALREAGAVAFLTKPVDVGAFWSAVRIALTPGRDHP